jgi:23S rRNA pseudouridine2605 synthase
MGYNADMRINKYLASTGLGSRRTIDDWIEQGKILVNDQPAQLGMQIDPEKDEIIVNGKLLVDKTLKQEKEYWKLNKPPGVVSTASDPHGRPTVVDLVKSSARLYPVGRLDQDSEGLMLLTNDGELTQKLTHPKFEIEKEYLVWVNGELTQRVINHLEKGVNLGDFTTAPAKVKVIFREPRKAKFSIVIHEGQTHQVRRMSAHAGLTVTRLKRVRMGSLKLGELDVGEISKLLPQEIEELKQIAGE